MKRTLPRGLLHFSLFSGGNFLLLWMIYFSLPGSCHCQRLEPVDSPDPDVENSTVALRDFPGRESASANESLYQSKLALAKKLAKCFSREGSLIPKFDSSSNLITDTKCSKPECEKCLKEVQDCESHPHSAHCREDPEEKAESKNSKSHKNDRDHYKNFAPDLAFHCNSANKNGTQYFKMEYEDPLVLEGLVREDPEKIPRVFVVEKLGTSPDDMFLTYSWLFSHSNSSHKQIRITPVAPSIIYNKITIPSLHFDEWDEGDSKEVPNITYVDYDPLTVGKGVTKILVRWKSRRGLRASCGAKVYFLDNEDPEFVESERKDPQDAFWTEINVRLNFGMSYNINIAERIADLEMTDLGKYELRTNNCYSIYNYSFIHCPPPKPVVETVIRESNGGLLISWTPPKHTNPNNQVLYYNLTISRSQILVPKSGPGVGGHIPSLHSIPTVIYHATIPGNETTWSIQNKNITFVGKIEVSIQANSPGGKSESASKTVEIHTGEERDDTIFHKIWMATLSVVLLIIIVFVGVFVKYHRDKLQRKKQLHEYFEKLDKESIHIEPPVDRYSCKWEIPLGDLILEDVIGEGAFGLVRKAVMYRNGRKITVAVKTLRDGVDENDSGKFWEEFNILKGLDPHKHVVGLVGIVKSHVPALVVEYCHGGDLQSYLRKSSQSRANMIGRRFSHSRSTSTNDSSSTSNSERRVRMSMVTNEAYFVNNLELEEKISELDLLSYGRQVACGMEFLSSNKIVHRDLAARNVLIGSNRTLKIADFGLSRDVYEQNWYKKSSNGKIPIKWLALECLLQEVYTTKSDVWSFGILLWEIVTLGGNPYPGVENTRIFDLLKSGYRMPQPENCSDELYALMKICWQEKACDRPDFTTIKSKLDEIIEKSNFVVYMNLDLASHSESHSYNTDEE